MDMLFYAFSLDLVGDVKKLTGECSVGLDSSNMIQSEFSSADGVVLSYCKALVPLIVGTMSHGMRNRSVWRRRR